MTTELILVELSLLTDFYKVSSVQVCIIRHLFLLQIVINILLIETRLGPRFHS